ncbi:hypothetical protein Mtc_1982 [Methanocella conradii HZ254]|uniref:Uncharacterized protein n=1 Tax=Methanocella conradii (strain DSM 24694 / JCM 17849 / CGMCC 1.5162 / HZ254) TaxID=1041930 RepID=H8I675_METCZ|nr:hypothetical protein [Methanocella conradii]AFD00722.1 hypothetical protein Mtc_1982 [Methanocella conradii HZ254]
MAQASTLSLWSSLNASLASHALSKTTLFMWDFFVYSVGLPVYHGVMSPVERMGFSISNTGTMDSMLESRMAPMRWRTTLLMLRVIKILRLFSSSSKKNGAIFILSDLMNFSIIDMSWERRHSLLPFQDGFISSNTLLAVSNMIFCVR